MDLQNEKLNIIVSCHNNVHCDQCYIDQNLPLVEPSFNKRRLSEIFRHFSDRGVSELSFIGGEPLLNSYQLVESMKVARNFFDHISMLTNGLLLDAYLLDELVALGLTSIKFNILTFDNSTFTQLARSSRTLSLPRNIIRYANTKLTTVLYVPLFANYINPIMSAFDQFMQDTNSTAITFLTTTPIQKFNDLEFYKNIISAGQLVSESTYLTIYNTAKYSIGFLDIISYLTDDGRYYIYPDMKVRASLSTLDSVYEF